LAQVHKRAVLHRKNALFYHTLSGAEVGDLLMSLIHTCEQPDPHMRTQWRQLLPLLTQLQRHALEVAATPSDWMPWNYRQPLEQTAGP
jgi:transposase